MWSLKYMNVAYLPLLTVIRVISHQSEMERQISMNVHLNSQHLPVSGKLRKKVSSIYLILTGPVHIDQS